MTLPRVAVLLASYNGSAFIREQIDSILGQEDVHVHVFVSDDGSTDGTLGHVAAYQGESVTVLPMVKSGGPAQNFFRLLYDAPWEEFDFVALSDQDDIWHADKLSRACAMHRACGLAAYSSNVTAFWPDGRRKLIQKAQRQRRMDYLFEAAGPGNTYVLSVPCARLIVARLGAAPPARVRNIALHDWLFYAIIRAHGLPWHIDPRPSLDYRQHQANVVGTGHSLRRIRKRLGMLMGDWYMDQLGTIAEIAGITGPEIDFIHAPSPAGLAHMLRHLGDYRRKKSEAAVLGVTFARHAFRRSG
jgi:Glycosyltransferases involved in cell wall biogenesis